MAGYEAWSEVHYGGDDGKVTKIMPGDSISAGDVGLEDDAFKEEYVDTGVAREAQYPVPEGKIDQSPTEFYKEQLAALANPEVDQAAYSEAIAVAAGLPANVDEAAAATQEAPADAPTVEAAATKK
jgi:hypothetical protein